MVLSLRTSNRCAVVPPEWLSCCVHIREPTWFGRVSPPQYGCLLSSVRRCTLLVTCIGARCCCHLAARWAYVTARSGCLRPGSSSWCYVPRGGHKRYLLAIRRGWPGVGGRLCRATQEPFSIARVAYHINSIDVNAFYGKIVSNSGKHSG
jgi:hypothetical protein